MALHNAARVHQTRCNFTKIVFVATYYNRLEKFVILCYFEMPRLILEAGCRRSIGHQKSLCGAQWSTWSIVVLSRPRHILSSRIWQWRFDIGQAGPAAAVLMAIEHNKGVCFTDVSVTMRYPGLATSVPSCYDTPPSNLLVTSVGWSPLFFLNFVLPVNTRSLRKCESLDRYSKGLLTCEGPSGRLLA